MVSVVDEHGARSLRQRPDQRRIGVTGVCQPDVQTLCVGGCAYHADIALKESGGVGRIDVAVAATVGQRSSDDPAIVEGSLLVSIDDDDETDRSTAEIVVLRSAVLYFAQPRAADDDQAANPQRRRDQGPSGISLSKWHETTPGRNCKKAVRTVRIFE